MAKFLWAFAATLLPASSALACTVCGFGREESRQAFLLSTALMSAVPVSGIGGLIYFLYKRSKS